MSTIEKEHLTVRKFDEDHTHKVKTNSNALNNRVWDESPIYWQNDSDYDFISSDKLEKMIKLAFLESSFETPLVIRQRHRLTADAQIKIRWLKKEDDPYFKQTTGVLAYAYGPSGGIGGDITMNASKPWWLGKRLTAREAFNIGLIERFDPAHPDNFIQTYDPLHTMKHEGGGHSLGMRHLTDSSLRYTAILYPFYNGLRKFGEADKNYLHELYGKASVSHRIKEMLLNRITSF